MSSIILTICFLPSTINLLSVPVLVISTSIIYYFRRKAAQVYSATLRKLRVAKITFANFRKERPLGDKAGGRKIDLSVVPLFGDLKADVSFPKGIDFYSLYEREKIFIPDPILKTYVVDSTEFFFISKMLSKMAAHLSSDLPVDTSNNMVIDM